MDRFSYTLATESTFTQVKLSSESSDMRADAARSPHTPPFPMPESISAAQGLLRYVVDTLRIPDASESRRCAAVVASPIISYNSLQCLNGCSTAIDMGSVRTLFRFWFGSFFSDNKHGIGVCTAQHSHTYGLFDWADYQCLPSSNPPSPRDPCRNIFSRSTPIRESIQHFPLPTTLVRSNSRG